MKMTLKKWLAAAGIAALASRAYAQDTHHPEEPMKPAAAKPAAKEAARPAGARDMMQQMMGHEQAGQAPHK